MTGVRRCDEKELEEYIEVLRAWGAGEEIELWTSTSDRWLDRLAPNDPLGAFGRFKYRVKPVEVKRYEVRTKEGGTLGLCYTEEAATSFALRHEGAFVVELIGTYTPK